MSHLVEFKINQIVTFHLFKNERLKAKVLKIDTNDNGKILYTITGVNGDSIESTCMGKCIEESVYFIPHRIREII